MLELHVHRFIFWVEKQATKKHQTKLIPVPVCSICNSKVKQHFYAVCQRPSLISTLSLSSFGPCEIWNMRSIQKSKFV